MRKIFTTVYISPENFNVMHAVIVNDEHGNKQVYKKEVEDDLLSKYTARQREIIRETNKILKENNQNEMTIEEMDWFVDPNGIVKKDDEITADELQKLSGFCFERQMVPFPSKK